MLYYYYHCSSVVEVVVICSNVIIIIIIIIIIVVVVYYFYEFLILFNGPRHPLVLTDNSAIISGISTPCLLHTHTHTHNHLSSGIITLMFMFIHSSRYFDSELQSLFRGHLIVHISRHYNMII